MNSFSISRKKMIPENIFTVLFVFSVVCHIYSVESTPENSRKPQLFTIRKRKESSTKPFIVHIRTPSSNPAGRSVPPHVPEDMVRESSIVRIKPIIRFHHSEDVVHLAPMNQTEDAAHQLHETLTSMGMSTMAHLLTKSGLDKEILQVGLVTLFTPTDEAFTLGPRGLLESLLDEAGSTDKVQHTKLRTFLLMHAIRGHLYSEDIRNDLIAKSLHPNGIPLRFNVYDGGQMISVSGSQFLGASKLTGKDRILVQPVDKVLYPVVNGNILDKTRVFFPEMHSLLIKAGLTDQLASGTFTLLAPTDDAFSGLPEKARDILLRNTTLLRKVMLNHIVPGTYFSTILTNGYKLKSLAGQLAFTTRRGLILVNGIPIVKPDLQANNGVIHALNRPLIPDELVDQCRCMPKYSLAPATLRPSPQPPFRALETESERHVENGRDVHTYGTRLKPLSSSRHPPYPGSVLLKTEHVDHIPVAESSRPSTSLESEDHDPSLDKILGSSIVLPNGRKVTFDNANRFFSQTLLINKIRYPGPRGLTILLPSDSAFSRLSPEHLAGLRQNPERLKRVLQWHLLDENLSHNTLRNNTTVRTISGSTLPVNVLPDKKGFLIGGVPILFIQRASNGAVFVVDHVFDPPPGTSISSDNTPPASAALQQNSDNDLSLWRNMIDGLPEVRQQLKSQERVYTMFALTNGAFRQLAPEYLLRLLADKDLQKDLIWSHVMLGAYYRDAISPGMVLPSVGGSPLTFDLIPRGFMVNDVPVTRAGIVTSNGVIYIVDKFLVFPPPLTSYRSLDSQKEAEAKPPVKKPTLEDIAVEYKATTFLKWILASRLMDTIRRQRSCTIFLPTDNAVSLMSPTLRMATVGNPKTLARFVRYHVCGGTFVGTKKYLETDDLMLKTLLPGKSVRCNVYGNGTVVTASGCPISKVIPILGDNENANDLSIIIVNQTLNPPVGDLFLTASKSPMLRNFTKIIKVSGMESELRKTDPLSIFAPTKCVFAKMPAEDYLKLITDPEAAKDFVKRHVVRGCIFTSGMSDGMTLTTLAGTTLKVAFPPDGCPRVNGAKLKYGDMPGTNGVLHVVDNAL